MGEKGLFLVSRLALLREPDMITDHSLVTDCGLFLSVFFLGADNIFPI